MSCHCVGDWNPGLGADLTYIPRHQGDPRKWNALSLPNSQTICQQRFDLKSRPEGKKLTQSKIRIPCKVHIPCIYIYVYTHTYIYMYISIWEVMFRWCSFASFFDRAPFLSSELLVSILRYLPWSNPVPEPKSLMRCAFLAQRTFDPWSQEPSKPVKTSVLPDVFAVWERQENKATSWIANVKITWSWLSPHIPQKAYPEHKLGKFRCGFLKSPLKEYSYLLYHILKP